MSEGRQRSRRDRDRDGQVSWVATDANTQLCAPAPGAAEAEPLDRRDARAQANRRDPFYE